MEIVFQTPRLILSKFSIMDAQNFYDLNSNPKVLQYTGDNAFSSIAEAEDFLKNYSDYKRNGYGRWAVLDKNSTEFLGWCGLKFDGKETDIGFRFFEEHWGKGYATESAKACLEYGFEELSLTEIIGRAMKENLASHKVLSKIGLNFSHEIEKENHNWLIYKTKEKNLKSDRVY